MNREELERYWRNRARMLLCKRFIRRHGWTEIVNPRARVRSRGARRRAIRESYIKSVTYVSPHYY